MLFRGASSLYVRYSIDTRKTDINHSTIGEACLDKERVGGCRPPHTRLAGLLSRPMASRRAALRWLCHHRHTGSCKENKTKQNNTPLATARGTLTLNSRMSELLGTATGSPPGMLPFPDEFCCRSGMAPTLRLERPEACVQPRRDFAVADRGHSREKSSNRRLLLERGQFGPPTSTFFRKILG